MKRFTASTLSLACTLVSASALAAETPEGQKLFADHCAACHGPAAEGDGPVASVMAISVPNLRTLAMRNGGKFPAESVRAYIDGREIKPAHGDRQMPIWGDVFRGPEQGTAERTVRRRIAALVDFIAEIQYR